MVNYPGAVQTGLGDGFAQQGATGRTLNPAFIRAQEFSRMKTGVWYLPADFAGLDVSEDHMQQSPTAATQSVLIEGEVNTRILVTYVQAGTTGGGGDFTFTLGEEGSDDDFIRCTNTQYSQQTFVMEYLLGVNKDLIVYRCDGNTGASPTGGQANVINIAYKLVHVPVNEG